MTAIEGKPTEGKPGKSLWKILKQMVPRWITRWFPASFIADEHAAIHRDLETLGRNIQAKREAMHLSRKDLAKIAASVQEPWSESSMGKASPAI